MADPILIISGTNRPGANALRVSKVLLTLYQKQSTPAEILDLHTLAPEAFTPEVFASKPPSVQAIQNQVLHAPGLHVVVPEYNGSFPGVLKHFIDLLKFPESFEAKPVSFVGLSAGTWGGLRAVEQLQLVFGYRNAHVFPNRVFIPAVHTKFDAEGQFSDADLLKRLDEQTRGFTQFVSRVRM